MRYRATFGVHTKWSDGVYYDAADPMKIFHDMGVLVDIFGTDAVELTITMEPDPAEADGESTR